MQAGKLPRQIIGVSHLRNTDIHFRRGFRRDDVAARSPVDHAWVYSNSAGKISELDELQDLMGKLDNRVMSFLKIHSCVRGQPLRPYHIYTHTFAGSLQEALQALCGLQHQHRFALPGNGLSNRT